MGDEISKSLELGMNNVEDPLRNNKVDEGSKRKNKFKKTKTKRIYKWEFP